MPRWNDDLETRFWSKVAVGDPDECWDWTAHRNHDYGAIKVAGKMLKAHRLAYELTNGEIPEGMCVCHSCDNPPCCNPAHLWLGTKQENNADRDSKNRQWKPKGEKHPRVKLTDQQVEHIRSLHLVGRDALSLAHQFGVSRRQVYNIVNRHQRCA